MVEFYFKGLLYSSAYRILHAQKDFSRCFYVGQSMIDNVLSKTRQH